MLTSGTLDAPKGLLPLCVDLDGTLIRGDLLFECLVVLARRRPLLLLMLPIWLCKGRAFLKHKLSSHVSLQVDKLPYRQDVLAFLREERRGGRQLSLVTAADQHLAEEIAAYLGLFDEVHGSRIGNNLKGACKADFLQKHYGEFEYIGDSRADIPVWQRSSGAYVAGSSGVLRRAGKHANVIHHFATPKASVGAFVRSIRLHHWTKNLLVLLPVILAHSSDWSRWRAALAGFFLFGFCASGLYVINDLLDLHSDRCHPWKNKRPFAAGELPLAFGMIGSVSLIVGTLVLSAFLSVPFTLILLGYAILTVWYSWKIKELVLVDVFLLTGFYAMRIVAGSVVASTQPSHWFIAFSGFFFFSLAMAKRNSELLHASEQVISGNSGRGYTVSDRDLLAIFGVASSFAAVVILALYAHSPEVHALYARPEVLLLLCPVVLYWLCRIWLLAYRGELNEDPVSFALRDRASRALGLLAAVVILLSDIHIK